MTTPTPRTYRLRVHDGDPATLAGFRAQPWDGTGALFVVDSDPTSDAPYLEAAPSGEGARVDPRTGRLTIGRYAVRVIDEVASAASTPSAVEYFDDAVLYAARWSSPGGTVGNWNLAADRLRMDISASAAGDAVRRWTVSGFTPGATVSVIGTASYLGLGGGATGTIALRVNGVAGAGLNPPSVGGGSGNLAATDTADGSGVATVDCAVLGLGSFRALQVDFDTIVVYEGAILGEGRVVTRHLADADARQQLLSRAAVLDLSGDGGATYPETLVNGYLTSLTLARALVWDLSVGDTLRDEADTRVWTEVTAAWPNASCLIGGPVLEPFPSAAAPAQVDQGPWTIEVTAVSADRVTARVTDAVLPQELASGPTKGLYASLNDKLLTHRALVLAQAAARPYFLPSATWSGSHGWFPRLRARLAVAGGGAAVGEFAPIAVAPFPRIAGVRVAALAATDAVVGLFGDATFLLDWPAGGLDTQGRAVPAQPAVGATFDLRVYPLDVSPRAPLHVSGHPVDLRTALWDELGIPYDAAAAAATKAALGSVTAALRITEPPTLGDLPAILDGPFGFAQRVNEQGERVLFPTRVRPGAAARTVTLADLRAPVEGPTFALEEKTAIAGVTYALRRFATWADAETDGERPMDGLVAIESRIVGERAAGDAAPYGAKELLYTVPGTVLTGAGGTRDLQAWCDSQAVPLVDRYGRGAVTTTLHVLDSAASLLGDELTLALPHRPGADAGQTPVAQRGTPEAVQVVGATRRVAGWDLEVVAVGVSAAAAPSTALPEPTVTVPVPTVTVAASGASPTTVATLTVTNAAAVTAAGLGARAESLVQAGAPSAATHGADLGWQDVASDATWDSPAAPAGATVWMRARAESLDGRVAGTWGAWTSVALGTITDGGGDVPGGASGAPFAPALAWVISGAGVVDVTAVVDGRTVAVKFAASTGAMPSSATVRAATADSSPPFQLLAAFTLAEGATGFVAAYAMDSVGNESALGTAVISRPRGAAPVTSVFGRTGAVVAATGDYGVAQVTGAAPLASPALTGTPTAPTAAPATNTTQLATTAYVDAAVAAGGGGAPLNSPAFTGNPTAPTPSPGDNDTTIATTAFVAAAVAGGLGGAFSPADLPGLALWLRADSIAQADGTAVASWPDRSVNGRAAVQATGANQPTYKTGIVNGQPVVRFDGVNDILDVAGMVIRTAGVTTYAVLQPAGTGTILSGVSGAYQVDLNAAGPKLTAGVSAIVNIVTGTTNVSTSAFSLLMHASDGAYHRLQINGTQEATTAADSRDITAATTRIGNYRDANLFYLAMDLAELIVVRGIVSPTHHAAVKAYVAARYGLTIA